MILTRESQYQFEIGVSKVLESHDLIDPYYFEVKRGKLVSTYKDVPIESVVVKDNPLGRAEYEGLLKIQDLTKRNKSGFIIWVSPKHPVYYPDASKIVISEIVHEGKKRLLNRSIKTNWDDLGSILVARELATLSSLDAAVFKTLTDIRMNPIFIDKSKEGELGQMLSQMLDQRYLEMIKNGDDWRIKNRYMQDMSRGEEVSYGEGSYTCPYNMEGLTAFQIFSGEARPQFVKNCPFCKKEYNKILKPGFKCTCGKIFKGLCRR